jgi:3-dehydro-4-phosphotetronate decarboxylase
MPSIKPVELDRLVAAGKRMYESGLVTGALGAIGARMPDGSVVVTADGSRLGFLLENDLVVMNGTVASGKEGRRLGKDAGIIRAVLAAQPAAGAALRMNSPYATALAHKGRKTLDKYAPLLEDLGGVAFVPYYRPGTAGLAGAVSEVMRSNRIAIIEEQGAIAWGKDVEGAIDEAEALEAAARVIFILNEGT